MKNLLLIFTLIVMTPSCSKDKTRPTEFFIKNLCPQKIHTHTCILPLDAGTETCADNNINSGITFSLRKINATDKITIKQTFTEIEISENGITSTKDPFDMSLWTKSMNGNNVEYTLTVDSLFF
jgi:hypothetical protein